MQTFFVIGEPYPGHESATLPIDDAKGRRTIVIFTSKERCQRFIDVHAGAEWMPAKLPTLQAEATIASLQKNAPDYRYALDPNPHGDFTSKSATEIIEELRTQSSDDASA